MSIFRGRLSRLLKEASPGGQYLSVLELTAAILSAVGSSSSATDARRFRDRALEIIDVVMGRRKGHATKRGTVVEDGPVEKEVEGRDVAAEWICQEGQGTEESLR